MPESLPVLLAALSLAVWVGLLGFRGGFWRAHPRLDEAPPAMPRWPDVVAVIPARNEARTIGRTVASLLDQDYPGGLRVVVVDDGSDDDTTAAAGSADRLTVISGRPLDAGWSGKLWAVKQGLDEARRVAGGATFVLLTDADIVHDPGSLRRLVAKAESDRLDLVSLMVRLRCESFWERLLIPAFVFFFQKLYPFPWVNDPTRPEAAAAGGCMLVRRRALEAAGGLEAIRGRLIDDCALAALIKGRGPIWLGLTTLVTSERRYDSLADVWRMVARSAYEQIGNSPLMLTATVTEMALAYGVPVLAGTGLLGGGWPAAAIGLTAWWGLMGAAYAPTLGLYGLARWRGVLLPLAAALYTLMTISSAVDHWRGRGSAWKGRTYRATSMLDG